MSEWLPRLVEAGVQATIVLGVAWAVAAGMRRASAATRHLLWTCALAGAVAAPLVAGVLPRWEVAVPGLGVSPAAVRPAAGPVEAGVVLRRPEVSQDADSSLASPAREAAGADSTVAGREIVNGALWPRGDVAQAVMAIWAAGVLAVLLRLAAGGRAAARLRRTSREPDAAWVDEARALAAAFGIAQPVRFVESAAIGTPMVLGAWRPVVAMPIGVDAWPAERRRLVLLHELAHVRRRDCLTQWLASLVCAVYWCNPLVWLSARRLRVERERACDDAVLAAGAAGPDYADHLLDIARTATGRSLLQGAGVAMARRSQLEGRLMAILDPAVRRSSALPARAAAILLVGAVSMPVAAIQLRPASPDEASPPRAAAAGVSPAPAAAASSFATPGPEPLAQAAQAAQSATQEAEASQDAQAERNGVPAPGGNPPDARMVDALIDALDDPDAGVRETVAQALSRTRDPRAAAALASLVDDADPDIREIAIRALARNPGPDALPALTAALQDDEADVREMAVRALGGMRDPATIDALGAALDDGDAGVREAAAHALAQLRDARALAPLTAALGDAEPDVREAAVFGLAQLRDPAALDALVAALRDGDPDVREQAAFALGQLRDPRAVEPLGVAIRDLEADVREQAVFALSQLRDPRSLDALVGALGDEMADVREQAAFALGELRDPRALDALIAALDDEMADVREQVARALGQLNQR